MDTFLFGSQEDNFLTSGMANKIKKQPLRGNCGSYMWNHTNTSKLSTYILLRFLRPRTKAESAMQQIVPTCSSSDILVLCTEMKKLGQRNASDIFRLLGRGEQRGGSQHVRIWQSFAPGWLTQRHCVPVIDALQQQMKLSAGRWLSSDSRSALSLQTVANKYVGFQSCQGRLWTVGQGAKRGAKEFPSPCNLFSISPVTSLGYLFSVSLPEGPRAPRAHTLHAGGVLWATKCSEPPIFLHKDTPRVNRAAKTVSESDTIWWRWTQFALWSVSVKINIHLQTFSFWRSQSVTMRGCAGGDGMLEVTA